MNKPSKKNLCNQQSLIDPAYRRINQDFNPLIPANYINTPNAVLTGVTLGTTQKRWTRTFVDIQNIQAQRVQCCVVSATDAPPATLVLNLNAYYFIYTNATVASRKIYKWNGTAFALYSPTEAGEMWLSRTNGTIGLAKILFIWNGTNLLYNALV